MCPVNAWDALQVIHHRYLSLITLSVLTQTGLPDKCGSSSKRPQLQSPHESLGTQIKPASGIFQYSMLSTNLCTEWRKKRGGCGSRHREAWNLVENDRDVINTCTTLAKEVWTKHNIPGCSAFTVWLVSHFISHVRQRTSDNLRASPGTHWSPKRLWRDYQPWEESTTWLWKNQAALFKKHYCTELP